MSPFARAITAEAASVKWCRSAGHVADSGYRCGLWSSPSWSLLSVYFLCSETTSTAASRPADSFRHAIFGEVQNG
jgi:hypothetical protein